MIAHLDALTEILNGKLAAAETKLVEDFSGVSGEIKLSNGLTLCFTKHTNRWGLFVRSADGITLLKSASRQTRIEAALELRTLRNVLLDRIKQVEAELRNAIAAAATSS